MLKQAGSLALFTASDGCQLAEIIHPQNDQTDPGLSLARAQVAPDQATSPHVLDFIEVYYILSGRGVMHLDQEERQVGPDDCVYVPPGSRQWIHNTSRQPLVFLCLCHPAYDPAGDHPA